MKILYCNGSESLRSIKNTENKASIKNSKEDKSGFIVEGSYNPRQSKIIKEGLPFIIDNEDLECFLYYKKKENNRVTGATILESIWVNRANYSTEKVQVPVIFQIMKSKRKKWLVIFNLNGNVGRKDFKEVVEALNGHYGRNNVVQAKVGRKVP